MAIGGGARNQFGRDSAAGTRPVLNDEGLPERFAEWLSDDTNDEVAIPARRERRDDS